MSDSAPPPPPPESEPYGSSGPTGATGPTPPGSTGPTGTGPTEPGQPAPYGSTGPGQPAPYGSTGRPAGMNSDQMKSAVQGAHKFDLAQIGLGVVIFIASFMPFYTVSYSGGGFSSSASGTAWHGFFGWFAVLLSIVAAAILVAVLIAKMAVPSMRLIVLGLFGAAVVCLVLALFIFPGGNVSGPGYDTGRGFGYWLALLCALGATALAFMRKDATDATTTA